MAVVRRPRVRGRMVHSWGSSVTGGGCDARGFGPGIPLMVDACRDTVQEVADSHRGPGRAGRGIVAGRRGTEYVHVKFVRVTRLCPLTGRNPLHEPKHHRRARGPPPERRDPRERRRAVSDGGHRGGPTVRCRRTGHRRQPHPWQGQPKPRPKAVTFEGTVALSNCSGAVVRLPNSTDRDPALVMSNGHCLEGGFPASGEVVVDRPSSRTSPSSTRVPVTRARCARRRSRTPR